MELTRWLRIPAPVTAIIAATVLFGIATPVLKVLLFQVTPLLLVALLSLGASSGVLCWMVVCRSDFASLAHRDIRSRERYLLAGTVITGGLLAPAVQYSSLAVTPAATASLLLNFEIVSTILIACLLFRETAGLRIGVALTAIFIGSILLSWNGGGVFDFSIGAAGIILSCLLWGLDNNCIGRISSLPPEMIVVIRGLCGGSIAGVLVILFHEPFPGWGPVTLALITGFISFGLGLVLFIRALRTMGAARAGTVFAAAPFIGCIASLLVFADPLTGLFWVALPFFIIGALLIIREQWVGRPLVWGK
jgi:drug/metabolite transporter (DMT)-like permease